MNTNKVQRVDTGVFETAQVGVEYYAREQHGNFFGEVYRQYFDLTSFAGAAITPSAIAQDLGVAGVARIIQAGGWYDTYSGSNRKRFEIPRNYTGGMVTTASAVPYIADRSTTGDLFLGVGNIVREAKFFVDYTKIAEPGGHSITHVPLDDLVRVDNGLIDSPPIDEVEYYARDQFGGFFGDVFRGYWSFSGPLSSSVQNLQDQVLAPLQSGGFVYDGTDMTPVQSAIGCTVHTDYYLLDNQLRLRRATSTGHEFDVWVDFVKE